MIARGSLIAALGIICSGCTGKIGDNHTWPDNPTGIGNATTTAGAGGTSGTTGGGTGGGASGDGGVVACASAATRRVRRLSQREYFNVVSDLLGPDAVTL